MFFVSCTVVGGIVTYRQMEYPGGSLPPMVGGRSHLRRDRLIGTLIRAQNSGHRLFLIEGQAGQGKSTLVAQYIAERAPQSFWYPVVESDRDSTWFIKNLLCRLKQDLSDFSSPFLEAMVEKCEIVSVDCYAYGKMLAESLANHPPVTFVFDDLHLLEADSPSVAFLKGFLGKRVPQRTLMFLSRYPLTDLLFDGRLPVGATRMTGETLAMNRGEIADCLTTLFRLTPTRERVIHLHSLTEGWIMGVLAQAQALHAAGDAAPLRKGPDAGVKAFLDQELIKSFPQGLLPLITDLSWCETIPMALARVLSGREDVCALFSTLVRRNFFTRFTSEDGTEAVFHHHLQHCLRERSRTLRSETELQDLFTRMARWYEAHGKPEDAARFFLDAGNHDEVERLLRERGLALCSAGRLETLRRSIGRIPETAIKERGWLSCNYGISLMEVDPPKALLYLEAAESCFQKNDDTMGLLTAQVQLIYYHTWVDALFNKGRPLLEPVHHALRALEGVLTTQVRIKVLYCLACGYAFFDGYLSQAALCADQALQLALIKGYNNAACEIRIIRCYINAFKGDWRRFNIEMEPLVPLLSSPRVSSYNRVIGWLTFLKGLLMEGDTANYRHYRELTSQVVKNEVFLHGIVIPLIHIWDMDASLSDGDIDLAEHIATEAVTHLHTGHNPHIQSLFLHYHAFILAVKEEHHNVSAICQKALAKRLESASPFFTALTQMVTGSALTLSGEYKRAESLLLNALTLFESMDETFERAGVLAHLSHLYELTGRHTTARPYTAEWLQLMKSQPHLHHFTWTFSMLGTLLNSAVAEGIEVETATRLSHKKLHRGYTPLGKSVPLLSISSFGCFAITMEGREVLTQQDLTISQQRLFALLLSRRDATLSVDEIQTLFWPDASPQKGRASLDTMVSRLKKTLRKAVFPYKPGDFLTMKKEKLVLTNVRSDVWRFIDLAEEGLQFLRLKLFWQAANRFRTAFALIKGPYLVGFAGDGTSHEHREYVLRPLIQRTAMAWTNALPHLVIPLSHDLAILEGYVAGDPDSQALVAALHHLYMTTNAPNKAASLLRKYRDKLTHEGMPEHEVESLLEEIWC